MMLFDLLVGGDGVRGQMKDRFGLEEPARHPRVRGGERGRRFVIRAALALATGVLAGQFETSRDETTGRCACPEGAGR